MSIWDHPDLKVGGEFIKLENQGDTVSGVIQVVRPHKFDDGSVAPQILLITDEGEERTLTAGQVRLKAELATQRPEAGDWIRVTLTQIEKRAGGKTLKHFSVEVRRGVGAPAQQAPAVPGYPAQAAPPAGYAPYPGQAPAQQYAPPAPPPPVQQYASPAPAPAAAPPAAPAAPAGAPPLTPEQQAAIAALSPEQRAALNLPA